MSSLHFINIIFTYYLYKQGRAGPWQPIQLLGNFAFSGWAGKALLFLKPPNM